MHIGKLIESMQVDGTNADIKIKNISSEIKSILLNDKYADLSLPLKNVSNFTLNYEGVYSNISKNFATDSENETRIATDGNPNSKCKAVVGNGNTKLNIKCQNCTVDFR